MITPFQEAILGGDTDLVVALLESGMDINILDKYNQPALMNAAKLGHAELVRCLVERGAALDITAKYRLTALMMAIIFYHEDVACILIEAGADLTIRGGKGAIGFFGKTALDLAKDREQERVVALLERYGAPSGKGII